MDIIAVCLESIPLALPHGLERVPRLEDGSVPRLGALVQVIHGLSVVHPDLGMAVRKTGGAPVEEASMEFVHGATDSVVPVHAKGFVGNQEGLFTFIFGVLDLVCFHERMFVLWVSFRRGIVLPPLCLGDGVMPGFSLYVFLPMEPFHGSAGIRLSLVMPTSEGFGSNGSWRQTVFAEKTVASTGNGDAMFEGVKPCQLLEFMGKFHTPFLEEADIGFAIGQQFLLKVELLMFCHTGSMPFLKFCFSRRAHAFRIVVVTGKNRSYVVFMFLHIKKMGEKTVCQFA